MVADDINSKLKTAVHLQFYIYFTMCVQSFIASVPIGFVLHVPFVMLAFKVDQWPLYKPLYNIV